MEALDATAEAEEEDAEEEARYRADLEERTKKAALLPAGRALGAVLNNLAAHNIETPLPAQDRAWGPFKRPHAIGPLSTATGKTLAYFPLAQRLLEKPGPTNETGSRLT